MQSGTARMRVTLAVMLALSVFSPLLLTLGRGNASHGPGAARGSAAERAQNAALAPLTLPCVIPPGTGGSGSWICTKSDSGYIVQNDTFDQVQGTWNVQCPGRGNSPGYFESTWIGIGGLNGALVQVGTTFAGDPDGGVPYAYYPFWEMAGNGGPTIIYTSEPLSCTTTMSAHIYRSGSQWCTSISWSFITISHCFGAQYQVDQSTADWIDERPLCPRVGFMYLYNFNYTVFSNALAHSTVHNWHTIGGFVHSQLGMYAYYSGAFHQNLAYPLNLYTGTKSFRDNWAATLQPDGVDCHSANPPYDSV